jgi:hypothetical protein
MSRQQSVSRNTVGYMLNNIDNQTTDGEEKSKPEVIKLGLDKHPTRSKFGWVGWTKKYDEYGNLREGTYFDESGKATLSNDGFARWRAKLFPQLAKKPATAPLPRPV